jgi:hypothetical protein
MDVFDVNGDKVGVVEDMYFGADVDDPQAHGSGARTTGTPRTVNDGGIVGDVMRAVFGDDELPETLRNRLLNDGFIRIEPGTLLGADMYATPDQITAVSGDGVRLNVTGDKLIRR